MSNPQSNPASQPPVDPMTTLHKMSTTAGLGSTDYVAINSAAVACIALGLASSLSIFADILLVIPFVGILFGIASIRQIRNSNGTQGGLAIASLGLLLSISFATFVVGSDLRQTLTHRADSRELSSLIDQLSDDVKAHNAQHAYSLFAPQFQSRVNFQSFTTTLGFVATSPLYGKLEFLRWNNVPFQFENPPGQKSRFAGGAMLAKFDQLHDPARPEIAFRNDGDGWKIFNIPQFFPSEQK